VTDPLGGLPERASQPQPRGRRPAPFTPTTIALLAAMVAIFLAELVVGHDSSGQDPVALLRMGSLYPPAVRDGDLWRLGSYAFLHIGWIHIAMNGYALWILMRPLETTFGQAVALGIFSATAMLAGGASYEWSLLHHGSAQAAGASGGVFGLFGATVSVYYRLRHRIPPEAMRAAIRALLINLAINAAIALSGFVDNAAHIGGFVSGIALGLVAPMPVLPRRFWHAPAQGLLIASAFVLAGMEGAALARAFHPHSRTLRGPSVEATVGDLLVPTEPGVAVLPGVMALQISREKEPLQIEADEDSVRIGERTFLRQRSAKDGVERTLLAAADGSGRLVLEFECGAPLCTGAQAESFYVPAARSLKSLR
jgi:membrane associated rhomboid family serine protease